MNDQSIVLRAQEIINNATATGGKITLHDAVRTALREKYGNDPERLLDVAASAMTGVAKVLRKATYELPEQQGLLDIPGCIAVSTPEGDLFIARDLATNRQVFQWCEEGYQYHSTHRLRFKKGREVAKKLIEIDPDANFLESRDALAAGNSDNELTGPEADDVAE